MAFLTREFFDTLIVIVIIIGLVLAARRLRQDLTRPLPQDEPAWAKDDTDPSKPKSSDT
jgi:hypothetical protein